MASWETFAVLFKFLLGSQRECWVSISPGALSCSTVSAVDPQSSSWLHFQCRVSKQSESPSHREPLGRVTLRPKEWVSCWHSTACKVQIQLWITPLQKCLRETLQEISYQAMEKIGTQGSIYRGTCRYNLLRCSSLLYQWGARECHSPQHTMLTGHWVHHVSYFLFTPTLWILKA